jgi:Fic family protein
MINKTTKDKIAKLFAKYQKLSKGNERVLQEIALAEIPEMVYNSNAIENSTLSLKDTEDIILHDIIKKDHNIREVYEAKNLAFITTKILKAPNEKLSIPLILALHKILLTHINDDFA